MWTQQTDYKRDEALDKQFAQNEKTIATTTTLNKKVFKFPKTEKQSNTLLSKVQSSNITAAMTFHIYETIHYEVSNLRSNQKETRIKFSLETP